MNDFRLVKLFDKIWEIWPNKDKPHSARKALRILNKEEDIDYDRFLAAANIYILSLNSPHCHELGNFIRNDIWRDLYFEYKNIFEYEKKLKDRREEALDVIKHWKSNRRGWWCDIRSEKDHIPQVEFAMRNKTFKEKWKEAFDILHSVFEKRFPEGDWRGKITPSLTWFCKINYDQFIVLKILEGEYGKPKKEKKFDASKLFPKRDTMKKEEAQALLKEKFGFLNTKKEDKELKNGKSKMKEFLKKQKQKDVMSKFGLQKT